MFGQRALALKAGKNSKRVNAFRNATHDGQIDFVQAQHLYTIDNARIASGAGCTKRQMRTRDSQVEGDLSGGIIGDGTWVVVVRPNFGIVRKLGDLVDFVLGFHVAVFGDSQKHAGAIFPDGFPVELGVFDRLVRAKYRDRTGSGASSDLFALLVAQFVKLAHAGENIAHIACLEVDHSRLAFEQILAKFAQRIAGGGRQADSGNDDAIFVALRWLHHVLLSVPKNENGLEQNALSRGREERVLACLHARNYRVSPLLLAIRSAATLASHEPAPATCFLKVL